MAELSIEKTSLWADIKDVFQSGAKPVKFEYRAMIHTVKEDIPVTKILSKDCVRDYANNVGDVIKTEFIIPLGDYITRIYPYRANLEFTIKRILLTDDTQKKQDNSRIATERYKAIFLVDENPNYTGTEYEQMDMDSLNTIDIVHVKLQLLDRSLEPLRIKTVSGVYRQTNQKTLLHALLAGESMKIKVDGKTAIDGVDIVDPDNNELKKHVILPSGTRLTSFPTYLQENMGGVYSAGIGNYVQTYGDKKMWFVYPLFRAERFKKSKDDRVIFYAVTSGKYNGADRTYLKDGSILKVAATSQRKYGDSADIDYINSGSGFRMADPRSYLKKPVNITADGPKPARGSLNTEVAAEPREDGLNYAPRIAASANPFKEYSRVNARNMARIDFVWENADPELLYPGMPCKYVFMEDGKVIELQGTIVFVHATTQLQGQGISGKMYCTNCAVTILAEQKPNTRKAATVKAQGTF